MGGDKEFQCWMKFFFVVKIIYIYIYWERERERGYTLPQVIGSLIVMSQVNKSFFHSKVRLEVFKFIYEKKKERIKNQERFYFLIE